MSLGTRTEDETGNAEIYPETGYAETPDVAVKAVGRVGRVRSLGVRSLL